MAASLTGLDDLSSSAALVLDGMDVLATLDDPVVGSPRTEEARLLVVGRTISVVRGGTGDAIGTPVALGPT